MAEVPTRLCPAVPATEAVLPGWPRKSARCLADLDGHGRLQPGRPATRPTPWTAQTSPTNDSWDPWTFDEARAERMREDDLCQLCGESRGALVFVLAKAQRRGSLVTMYGGALCTLRCALLTAATCPHYQHDGPIELYRLPRQERVDLLGGGYANDDEYDLTHD